MMFGLPVWASIDNIYACQGAWNNSPAAGDACVHPGAVVTGLGDHPASYNEDTEQCEVFVVCETDSGTPPGGYNKQLLRPAIGGAEPAQLQWLLESRKLRLTIS